MRIIEVKKLLPFLLTAALLTGCLTGCGEEPGSPEATNSRSSVSASVSEGKSEAGSPQAETAVQSENALNGEDLFTKRDLSGEIGTLTASVSFQGQKANITGQGVSFSESEAELLITEEGTYELSGTLQNGRIVVDAPEDAKVQLVLAGLTVNIPESAAICIRQADKVFVTVKEGSVNYLTGSDTYESSAETNVDAVIYSKCDLTINGTGTLNIEAVKGHGIFTKKDLKIADAELHITSGKHGLAGKNSVRIASGQITINSAKDGIHSEPKTDDDGNTDPSKGYVYLGGGSLDITTADDGIHAENLLQIDNGTINIRTSYEGLESKNIIINNGNITLKAKDDGINAASSKGSGGFGGRPGASGPAGSSNSLLITGGQLFIDAEGDGIDSNGTLTVTGGEIIVSGPVGNGDSALDYDMSGQITGGKVIALGSSGMAMNFGATSTQGSILVNTQTMNAGTEVTLKDAKGNALLSFTATKPFSSVVVSCPELVKGGTYTLTIGDQTTEITLEDLIYGSGGGFGGGHGGFGGMGGFEGEHGNRGDRGDLPEGFDGQFPEGFGGKGERPEGFGGKGDRPEGFEGKGPGKR